MNNIPMTDEEKCKTIINDMGKWSRITITKDVRRYTIEPDFMGLGECEDVYYIVTCYVDGEELDSVSTKSIVEAGEIAQSYETFIKYYSQK